MNRFAELLDRLAYEPGRNNKLRLITDYFRTAPDPERGFALAALTGALSFRHAKPGIIRALIAERTDPVLFELSYDYVGDLSETVALMWPLPPSPRLRGGGEGEATGTERCAPLRLSAEVGFIRLRHYTAARSKGRGRKQQSKRQRVKTTFLTTVVTTLASLGKTELPTQLARWLDELDETGRWALLKLVTGGLRIGVSARLAKTAVAALGDKDAHEIELIWPGLAPPYPELFAWIEGRADKPAAAIRRRSAR